MHYIRERIAYESFFCLYGPNEIYRALGAYAQYPPGKHSRAFAAAVAMFHEASEIITGDLATPIKYYNPEIKKAYKELEHIACGRLIDMLPPELQEVYSGYMLCRDNEINKIVKWADKLCAYFKCVEELNLGNTEFASAEKSILAEIEKIDAPEVKYFMEHFAPSFKLNLDQMG